VEKKEKTKKKHDYNSSNKLQACQIAVYDHYIGNCYAVGKQETVHFLTSLEKSEVTDS
jgi:hypothetical protein